MNIELSKKDRLTIESFAGKANGREFTGVRFKLGKRTPKTVFHMHHSKALAIIEALNEVVGAIDQNKGTFYETPAWQRLRYETLKKYRKCCLCGRGDPLHVDHIKPRSLFPALELEPDNMQVLCKACNIAKSNRDTSDYRNGVR
ncbi:MAG: HNH endonuclease [Gammaproteobacteria bacterium]|nr:HNH endonuclease [Gammaproteobacteria bacterium]